MSTQAAPNGHYMFRCLQCSAETYTKWGKYDGYWVKAPYCHVSECPQLEPMSMVGLMHEPVAGQPMTTAEVNTLKRIEALEGGTALLTSQIELKDRVLELELSMAEVLRSQPL